MKKEMFDNVREHVFCEMFIVELWTIIVDIGVHGCMDHDVGVLLSLSLKWEMLPVLF